MRTDSDAARRAAIEAGAALLRSGRLVAFPTETVYGLGAHALDDAAVARIYEAKGRPAINPLIVHVPTVAAARALAAHWPDSADAIARAFWPGPVTLVVRKRAEIPQLVTAGRDSVGLRVPAHPLALALLEAAGIPIAAPSANRSTQVSPTSAHHVERGLGSRVDLIIDGGPTTVGIESTVVDVTGPIPRVLRPGMIARDAIARVAGGAEMGSVVADGDVPRSPGLLGRHYAPRARLVLADADQVHAAVAEATGQVGAMTFGVVNAPVAHRMPREPEDYARVLYATLHAVDDAGCDVVVVERPPDTPAWAAIRDRLERATR